MSFTNGTDNFCDCGMVIEMDKERCSWHKKVPYKGMTRKSKGSTVKSGYSHWRDNMGMSQDCYEV